MTRILDNGNGACALAVKAANVDVVAAYPITPQTSVAEKLAQYIGSGQMNAKYLPVESEHSVMSAVAAACAVGARTFTATSSQGLLYMHEILHYAAGGRLPVVMANINRAVCAPWCLYADHQDSVSQRDTGWMQFYASTIQEIYDSILIAYKVAEKVLLPIMVNYDGFLLSHSMMPFDVLDQATVDKFLPPFEPKWKLHPQFGGTFGSVAPADVYAAYRREMAEDFENATDVIEQVIAEYETLTGHKNAGLIEPYRCEDANVFLLSMGSMASEMELVADQLREKGIKVGTLRVRVFRPFPMKKLAEILPKDATLLVFDRNTAFGTGGGALLTECKAALYHRKDEVKIAGKIVGMGGDSVATDVMVPIALQMLEEL